MIGAINGFLAGTGAKGAVIGGITGTGFEGNIVGGFVRGMSTIRNESFSTDPMVPVNFLPSYVVTVRLC